MSLSHRTGTRRLRACALLFLSTCLTPALARAQSIRGTVVDRADTPVPGVVVILLDDKSSIIARSLSSDRGEFHLAATVAGTYRVRTMRIGFKSVISDPVVLRAGETVTKRFALSGVSVSLDTVRVLGRNACHLLADSAAATFAVWGQVRTALTATQLSTAERAITATTLDYERLLDKNLDHVREQTTTVSSRFVKQPWASLSPERLRDDGYVVSADDSTTYYGPGLDVLLSDTFIADHCFRLANSPDPNRIGIEFEPTSDRGRIADIRGTLWIDRATSELRRLEFRYTGISREQEQRSGGNMDFVRLRNGAWAIASWDIRMPVLGRRRGTDAARTIETYVLDVRAEGGTLIVASRGTDTLWAHAPLTLNGVVSDSVTGVPVPNARVVILGTKASAITDSVGRFSIPDLLPGAYSAELHTRALDAIGVLSQTDVTFVESSSLVQLRMPDVTQLGSAMCGASVANKTGIVIGGLTMRGDAVLPVGVRVFASWSDLQEHTGAMSAGTPNRQRRGTVDARGHFRICGVPTETPLVVQAELDSASAPATTVRIADGLFVRADLIADRLAGRGVAFTGRVFVDSTHRAIAGAEVALPELSLSERTDSAGAFRFLEIPAGEHQITVRRLGYGALDTRITFTNKALDRQIFLSRMATLDSVRVVADRVVIKDFEDNRKIGLGPFLTRDQLAKAEGRPLMSVIEQLPGAQIEKGRGNHAWLIKSRGVRTEAQTKGVSPEDMAYGAKPACYAHVYVDGFQVYGRLSGGDEPLFDLSSMSPAQIESVEYYSGPAQTPMKYSGMNSTCGVLVIWTRRSR